MLLPPDLAPWGAALQILPAEEASVLGPIVRALSLLIGPVSPRDKSSTGEPEGFSGLTHTPAYDRLLLSEWLLADEIPEEFLRRAATGEHVFLERERVDAVAGAQCVALLDSSPDQAGAPRLAQMAALIVLARRAEEAGTLLRWGIAQEETSALRVGLFPAALAAMAASRPRVPANAEAVLGWREALDGPPEGETWLIGGQGLQASQTGRDSFLEILDPLIPEERVIDIRIHRPGLPVKAARLSLPPDGACARLLRSPLGEAAHVVREARALPPTSPLVFQCGSTRLIARSGVGQVIVYPVPNVPGQLGGQPRVYHPFFPNAILAAARWGKPLAIITAYKPDQVILEFIGGRSDRLPSRIIALPEGVQLRHPEPADTLDGCYQLQSDDSSCSACLVLVLQGNAIVYPPEPAGAIVDFANGVRPPGEWIATHVTATRADSTRVRLIGNRVDGGRALLSVDADAIVRVEKDLPPGRSGFLGCGGRADPRQWVGAADTSVAGRWLLFSFQREAEVDLPAGLDAAGALVTVDHSLPQPEARDYKARLVCLDDDRRTIMLVGPDGTSALPRASAPIARLSVSPYAGEVAYLTEGGEIVIYGITQKSHLYRFMTEDRQ